MQIQHLTLGGGSVLKDLKKIDPGTAKLYSDFRLSAGTIHLPVPDTGYTANITVEIGGAFFDILKDREIGYTVFCCLAAEQSEELFKMVRTLTKLSVESKSLPAPVLPETNIWLYSVPVLPNRFTTADLDAANDIAFIIFCSLLSAYIDGPGKWKQAQGDNKVSTHAFSVIF